MLTEVTYINKTLLKLMKTFWYASFGSVMQLTLWEKVFQFFYKIKNNNILMTNLFYYLQKKEIITENNKII